MLPTLSYVEVDDKLEMLTILVKSARPHERANYTLKLAEAFGFHNVSLDLIRRIHRCYGYGQRMDSKDFLYYSDLQHIIKSLGKMCSKSRGQICCQEKPKLNDHNYLSH